MKGYGTAHEIALYVNRPVKTIRTWGHQNLIPTLKIGQNGVTLYHAATARRLAEERPRRHRRRSAQP